MVLHGTLRRMRILSRVALLFSVLAGALAAQQLQQNGLTIIVGRMPNSVLQQALPGVFTPASPDLIQIMVWTTDPNTNALRVTLTYQGTDGNPVTVSSLRNIQNQFDMHSFPVPVYTVKVISVQVDQLQTASSTTFQGF